MIIVAVGALVRGEAVDCYTVRCALLTYCIAFNTVAAAEHLASVCFTEVYKACIVPVTFCCARWTVEQADGIYSNILTAPLLRVPLCLPASQPALTWQEDAESERHLNSQTLCTAW